MSRALCVLVLCPQYRFHCFCFSVSAMETDDVTFCLFVLFADFCMQITGNNYLMGCYHNMTVISDLYAGMCRECTDNAFSATLSKQNKNVSIPI